MGRTLPVVKVFSSREEFFFPANFKFDSIAFENEVKLLSIEDELSDNDIAFIRAMFPVRSWFSRTFLGKEYIP